MVPKNQELCSKTGSDSRFNNPANNSIDVVSRGGGGGGSSNSDGPDVDVRDGTGGGSCGGVGSKNGLVVNLQQLILIQIIQLLLH